MVNKHDEAKKFAAKILTAQKYTEDFSRELTKNFRKDFTKGFTENFAKDFTA